MRFHTRLFLSFAAVVILTVLLEGVLDFAAASGRSWLEGRSERHVNELADSLAAAIELRGEVPVRSGIDRVDAPSFREMRYRVVASDRVLLGERGEFPAAGRDWALAQRPLVAGMRLELALARSPFERFLGNHLLVDLVDLPLFLGLAFLISWLLSRAVVRPMRELTEASEQLAQQHFPEPLAVPAGDDELGRMARSFNRMSSSIHGYLERERALTRYASHELRTPLAALKTQIEQAKYGLVPAQATLPALERNVERLEGILDALLSLARQADRNRDSMPLSPVLSEILRSLPRAQRARVRLAEPDYPVVVSDARLVQQAAANLLTNALKYTDGSVDFRVATNRSTLRIEVRDEGPGLPDEVLASALGPERSSGDTSAGSGLGLPLVARITGALKGRFELRNLRPGLSASLHLPVVADARSGAPELLERPGVR